MAGETCSRCCTIARSRAALSYAFLLSCYLWSPLLSLSYSRPRHPSTISMITFLPWRLSLDLFISSYPYHPRHSGSNPLSPLSHVGEDEEEDLKIDDPAVSPRCFKHHDTYMYLCTSKYPACNTVPPKTSRAHEITHYR
ncbi:hypothetical protein F4805DRAFT_269757 [Annulohypoxylon moriforme]|nr:hypothetical protein F4805DRAFT_269757 [Annulohypoxylon moriforme]